MKKAMEDAENIKVAEEIYKMMKSPALSLQEFVMQIIREELE